jgi:hypothetical protein
MARVNSFTETESQFIKANYLKIPIKTIGRQIGRSGCGVAGFMKRNALVVPKNLAEQRKKNSHFKTGMIAHNKGKKQTEFMSAKAIESTKKTRFKKGRLPHNTNYNGHERITKDGYIEMRISVGKYRLKHLYNWEKLNGKLPKSHCLMCLDSNKLNADPSNWRLISRSENMFRNSKLNYAEEVISSLVIKRKLTKQIENLDNYGS